MHIHTKGRLGEALAGLWLLGHGWLPGRPPRRLLAQVDWLAWRPWCRHVCVVEVKLRRALRADDAVPLRPDQQSRLHHTARQLAAALGPLWVVRIRLIVVQPRWPWVRATWLP